MNTKTVNSILKVLIGFIIGYSISLLIGELLTI